MRNTIKILFKRILSITLLLVLMLGCKSYFENPLEDKETGEDVNLLILDFNFFTTRMTYKIMDAADGAVITSSASVSFTGENGTDIVTFTGDKQNEFITDKGQLELTVDPNVPISENSPLEFAVNVEVDGYNTLSKGIQFRQEGKKTIELLLTKIADEKESDLDGNIDFENGDTTIIFSVHPKDLKSVEVTKPYAIEYGISINDFLKLKNTSGELFFDSLQQFKEAANRKNFVKMKFKYNDNEAPGIDLVDIGGKPESVLLHKLESGRLDSFLVMGQPVGNLNGAVITSSCKYTGPHMPDIFGFATFEKDSWIVSGTDTVYTSLDFQYTVAGVYLTICGTGANITFKSNVISSFSIDADVLDSENNFLYSINFKGNFPETFVLENVPEGAVIIKFRDNLASFEALSPVLIDNVCDKVEKVVNVAPVNGYKEYQIVLKAICPDNKKVAVAPTYSAEVKIKGSNDPWQGIDLTSGVVDLLGLEGKEYQFRLLWENDWEYSTYWTDFDVNGNYLHTTDEKTTIKSEKMDDGRIRILVDQKFNQNVCKDLGW